LRPGTLRNWEQRYRLLKPSRTRGGTRLYRAADVERIFEIQWQLAHNGNSLLAIGAGQGLPPGGSVAGIREAEALYALAQVLTDGGSLQPVLQAAASHLLELLDGDAAQAAAAIRHAQRFAGLLGGKLERPASSPVGREAA